MVTRGHTSPSPRDPHPIDCLHYRSSMVTIAPRSATRERNAATLRWLLLHVLINNLGSFCSSFNVHPSRLASLLTAQSWDSYPRRLLCRLEGFHARKAGLGGVRARHISTCLWRNVGYLYPKCALVSVEVRSRPVSQLNTLKCKSFAKEAYGCLFVSSICRSIQSCSGTLLFIIGKPKKKHLRIVAFFL